MVSEKKSKAKDLTNVATKTADVDADLDGNDGASALAYEGAEEAVIGHLSEAELREQILIRQRQADDYFANESFWDKMMFSSVPLNLKPKALVTVLGAFAAFSGILSGFDQSIISGATHGIQKYFTSGPNPEWHWDPKDPDMLDNHSASQWSLVSSLMPLGAMAGSLGIMPLNAVFGRRGSIVISCLWYTLGAGLCAGTRTVGMLYAGRFILGIGVGIEGGCVGIYISECVPPNVRGSLVSIYQFMIAFGEVLGYAAGGVFFDIKSGNWRYMLGSSVLFSTILLIGLVFMPESPRWLNASGRNGRGFYVWTKLRDINEPESMVEYLAMEHASAVEAERAEHENWYERYLEVCMVPRNRRALIYASIMIFLGQMTGINSVLYNLSNLMGKMNFNAKNSVLMSLVGGGALWLGTIPAILWMDRFGRRTWAQNILGFIVGLVLVGVGYLYTNKGDDYFEDHRSTALGLYFTGLILYMGFFGTYSCLTWVVPAESFALRTRAQGMAICSAFLYLWSFIVTYNFQGMVKAMTYTGLTTGFFGGLAVVGFFYQLFFMPETTMKTLEEVDALFEMPTRKLVALNMRNLGQMFPRIFGKLSPSHQDGELGNTLSSSSEPSRATPTKEQ